MQSAPPLDDMLLHVAGAMQEGETNASASAIGSTLCCNKLQYCTKLCGGGTGAGTGPRTGTVPVLRRMMGARAHC